MIIEYKTFAVLPWTRSKWEMNKLNCLKHKNNQKISLTPSDGHILNYRGYRGLAGRVLRHQYMSYFDKSPKLRFSLEICIFYLIEGPKGLAGRILRHKSISILCGMILQKFR